jgi:hypothetical protein
VYDLKQVEDPKTLDFWAYQALVALRGDWDRLHERCRRIAAAPPPGAPQNSWPTINSMPLSPRAMSEG